MNFYFSPKILSKRLLKPYQIRNFTFIQIQSCFKQKIKCCKINETNFKLIESIVGKGENDGYQHFHLFPLCFQKTFD